MQELIRLSSTVHTIQAGSPAIYHRCIIGNRYLQTLTDHYLNVIFVKKIWPRKRILSNNQTKYMSNYNLVKNCTRHLFVKKKTLHGFHSAISSIYVLLIRFWFCQSHRKIVVGSCNCFYTIYSAHSLFTHLDMVCVRSFIWFDLRVIFFVFPNTFQL